MSNLYRGPPIDASYQVSVHLAQRFQRRRFLEIDQSKTRIGCGSQTLLMNRDEMSNRYRGPSKDAPYQVSIHLAKWFQRRRFFRNQPIRNKNCLWRPCLITDRDEMSILYRGPSKDASYGQAVSEVKFFFNRPIRNKNCLWRTRFLMDRDKMSNLQRGPSIDASYQISLHLADGFQRRRLKCEKLTTTDAKRWQKLTLPLARRAKKK